MANVLNVLNQTRKGGAETLVELDDPKRTKVWRPTDSLQGGGGSSGGGGSVDPLSYLSPGEAISYAKLIGEGSAVYPQLTEEQINQERSRISGVYRPFFDTHRQTLNTVREAQKQEAGILRTQIADNYDDAFKQLAESYNRKGLHFSGQSSEAGGRVLRDKANSLTRTDLALQQTLADISSREADLGLREQQEIESALREYIVSQTEVNEGIGKQRAASITAELAGQLLEGIGGRLAQEKAFDQAEKAERLRLGQSAEERGIAALTGIFRGDPTLSARNIAFNQEIALARETREQELHPLRLQKMGIDISRAQASLANLRSGGLNSTDLDLASAMVLGGAAPYTTLMSQIPQKNRPAFNRKLYQDYVQIVQEKEQASRVVPLSEFNDYLRGSQQQFKDQSSSAALDAAIADSLGIDLGGFGGEEDFDFLNF